MSIYMIVYIILAALLIVWLLNAPHTPTSLDPEPPPRWANPMLPFLLIVLGLGALVVHALTN